MMTSSWGTACAVLGEKSLAVRGSTSVNLRSCSVRSLHGGRDFCGLPLRSCSLVGLTMKLRLMLRYLHWL